MTATTAYAAKSTQRARQNYWSAVAAGSPAWRIMASAQALRIAHDGLVRATGSEAKAAAAEVAYIASLTAV